MDSDQMLLLTLIDERARTEPDRLYCVLLKSSKESDGVIKITYRDWANAINRCAWWIDSIFELIQNFNTLAYLGPTDIRYALITLAAAKAGFKALLLSPANRKVSQGELFRATEVLALLVADGFPTPETLKKRINWIRIVEGVEYWLTSTEAEVYPFKHTLDDNPSRPFVVLETLGSTGLPVPITYTFAALTAFQQYLTPKKIIKRAPPTIVDVWKDHCLYVALPPFHTMGLLFMTAIGVYWNMPPIIGPPDVSPDSGHPNLLPSAELVSNIIKMDICEAVAISPTILEEMAKDNEQLRALRSVKYVIWSGSPFSSVEVSNKIRSYVDIYPAYSATEFGPLPLTIEPQENHEWMNFNPIIGATLRHFSDDLYELILVKNQKIQSGQFVFLNWPELSEWPTKDLMSKHPTKELWRYSGRRDDMIVLSDGLKINPCAMEAVVMAHAEVRFAILVGNGYSKPMWIIELENRPTNATQRMRYINHIWPVIERANEIAPAHGRVSKSMVLLTTKFSPMLRSEHGWVQRRRTIDYYQQALNAVHETECQQSQGEESEGSEALDAVDEVSGESSPERRVTRRQTKRSQAVEESEESDAIDEVDRQSDSEKRVTRRQTTRSQAVEEEPEAQDSVREVNRSTQPERRVTRKQTKRRQIIEEESETLDSADEGDEQSNPERRVIRRRPTTRSRAVEGESKALEAVDEADRQTLPERRATRSQATQFRIVREESIY